MQASQTNDPSDFKDIITQYIPNRYLGSFINALCTKCVRDVGPNQSVDRLGQLMLTRIINEGRNSVEIKLRYTCSTTGSDEILIHYKHDQEKHALTFVDANHTNDGVTYYSSIDRKNSVSILNLHSSDKTMICQKDGTNEYYYIDLEHKKILKYVCSNDKMPDIQAAILHGQSYYACGLEHEKIPEWVDCTPYDIGIMYQIQRRLEKMYSPINVRNYRTSLAIFGMRSEVVRDDVGWNDDENEYYCCGLRLTGKDLAQYESSIRRKILNLVLGKDYRSALPTKSTYFNEVPRGRARTTRKTKHSEMEWRGDRGKRRLNGMDWERKPKQIRTKGDMFYDDDYDDEEYLTTRGPMDQLVDDMKNTSMDGNTRKPSKEAIIGLLGELPENIVMMVLEYLTAADLIFHLADANKYVRGLIAITLKHLERKYF